MKKNRYLLAVVLSAALGACTVDVTEPGLRADALPSLSTARDTTPPPPAPYPVQEPTDGMIGSGVGK